MNDIIRLTEIQEGNDLFQSRGFSYVKVTKDGKVVPVVIPIKSSGVSEVMEELLRKAPTPPDRKELVYPDSEYGKQLGLTQKKWVFLPDFTDPEYLAAKDKFDSDMMLKVVIMGLDTKFVDKEGKPIDDEKKKLAILKGLNLATDQMNQIMRDITSLTRWREGEEQSFLSMNSEGTI